VKIEASSLGTCSVTKGGDRILLGFVGPDGQDIEIKVLTADACAIAMTLPRLLKNSLWEKHHDASLRYVFPLDTWKVEAASDGTQVILTFATDAGFEISFASKPDMVSSLGSALFESAERTLMESAASPN